jgi:hypothetical protein
MIETLYKSDYPDFLKSEKLIFDLDSVLKESIFQVTQGEINWSYIEHLHGNFFSIIHIHHNFQRDNFELLFDETPLREYKTIHRESIDIVKNWGYAYKQVDEDNQNIINTDKFCEWFVFENSKSERLSLLFISDEFINAFKILFLSRNVYPLVIAHKFSYLNIEWTRYIQEQSFIDNFYNNGYKHPIYLLDDNYDHLFLEFPLELYDLGDYKLYSNLPYDNRNDFLSDRMIDYHKFRLNQMSVTDYNNFKYVYRVMMDVDSDLHYLTLSNLIHYTMEYIQKLEYIGDLSWADE